MKKIFSRSRFLEWAKPKELELRTKNRFRISTGWIQVAGRGESINREYGKWIMVRDIIFGIEGGYI